MAIKIASDLVMDVMRAAEPQRLAMARARLANAPAKTSTATATQFAATPANTKAVAAKHTAHQQFEAAMLRSFTEQMMPKEASSFYGEGTAANIWRSVQVDLMSQNLAKAGGIGIADMLDKSEAKSAASKTAETLALNELGGGGAGTTQLAVTPEWPYFQRASGAD